MDTNIIDIILLITALVVHELGHYFHFYIGGFKPKFCVIGFCPAVQPNSREMNVGFAITNRLFAVVAGSFVALTVTNNLFWFAYLVGCFFDLCFVQSLIMLWDKKYITWRTKLSDIKTYVNSVEVKE